MTDLKEKSPLTRRFIAYLIDWYIGGLATALPVSILSMRLFGTVQNQNIMSFGGNAGLLAGVLAFLCGTAYFVLVPAFVWRGQTLAKRWLKLVIVSADGGQVSTGQIFLRQLLGIIVIEGSLVTVSALWHQLASMITGVDFVTILMYAGLVISGISALMVVFGGRRALHDHLAKTAVVMHE